MVATTHVKTVTDATFDREVRAGTGLILVDFSAAWCPPCRFLEPVLDEIAHEQAGRLTILKLDTDENQRTTERFDVRGMPTMIVFRDGEPIKQIVGAKPKAALLRDLAPLLAQ